MIWIAYALLVLAVSGLVGLHLGKFRDAYTEMTGMMVGMTMGMVAGFLLGYAAGAFTASMFWGNLAGMTMGLGIGVLFGRAGGLMGIMDGAMGGFMGGSMGAMLAVMLFAPWALLWTAAFLALIYLVTMVGLVVLIERSAPDHAALHRLMPVFTRSMATEASEEIDRQAAGAAATPQLTDYYALLGISRTASPGELSTAYLAALAAAKSDTIPQIEQALSILTDPARRAAYDARLGTSGEGDCCPPPRKKDAGTEAQTIAATVSSKPATARARGGSAGPSRPKQAASSRTRSRAVAQEKEAPISWIGGVMALFIVIALGSWWGLNTARPAGTGADNIAAQAGAPMGGHISAPPGQDLAAQLEPQAVAAPLNPDGTQEIDVIVNGDKMSYSPNVIKVKQGAPVHFNLKVEGRDPG